MENEKFEIDFLTNKDNYYLASNKNMRYEECEEIDLADLALYQMEEISFEDQSPRKEALENVLSTMKIDGINFIYLILGDGNGVHFYYGISRNYASKVDTELSIYDIGRKILEPSIKGNFRGSHIKEVEPKQKKEILDSIVQMNQCSILEGVPGATKEDEKFQGVDRLADVMMGDNFGFMIIASPTGYDEIKEIERNLYEVYSRIVPFAKKSMQLGTSKNESRSTGESEGTSDSTTENYSKSKQESINISNGTTNTRTVQDGTNTSKGTSTNNTTGNGDESKSNGTTNSGGESHSTSNADGTTHSEATTTGGSETSGQSKTNGSNKSISTQETTGTGETSSTTMEYIDKKSQDWIKYLDEVIMPRLDYGMGKGIFITTSFLFSNEKPVLKKLENTAISLYSGEEGNKVPLRAIHLDKKKKQLKCLQNFQLPNGHPAVNKKKNHEAVSRSALSQYMKSDDSFVVGNWITTNELAMIAGLPQKEVVGLSLREEVEFGLNCKNDIAQENRILLGHLVQNGNILENCPVYLDKQDLDKHIFVSGVTGSGKTTTCQNILISSEIPFLVIEPAKTEYRILKQNYKDLLVFTLGNENVGTPFRLNPFEFFQHESITSRVDMIKASIEAAFDMEAAIPQIIESAIYECYEDYGWVISTNKNTKYENPFEDGVYAFPTLQDLIEKIPEVVEEQGFDTRLKNDYIGSIKARLMGLLVGSKGLMLNTKRSLDFMDLLDRRVVLELEEIRNGSEKSLIMGFVLTNLMQAIKGKFLQNGVHRHITLVEEAHRLLSKFVAGDSPSKKQGVETFADMLAEIRKYGESLVIVDQIPNKLTPEVLKNTNTKIVHKLFASDDKDAIGNTIVLGKDQKEFLSNLDTGRAIVFSQGYAKALQVQIKRTTDTDAEMQIAEEELRDAVYDYYAERYKKGIIINTQFLSEKPNREVLGKLLESSKQPEFCEAIYEYGMRYQKMPSEKEMEMIKKLIADEQKKNIFGEIKNEKDIKEKVVEKEDCVATLKKYLEVFEMEYLVTLLAKFYYNSKEERKKSNWYKNKKKSLQPDTRMKYIAYIEKYVSEENLSFEDARKFRDLL